MKNYKTGLLVAFAFSILFTACGGEQKNTTAQDTRPTVKVTLAKVGSENVNGFTSLSGKIQAQKYVNVSARLMGYLMDVKTDVGSRVKKGQRLATIKSDEILAKKAQAEAGIAEAEAGLENIEKDYGRIKSLFDKNSATQKELDDITAAKKGIMAKIKQAVEMKNEVNTMLSYSQIIAPFNGVVTEKHVNSGDLATPGRSLFTIEGGNDFQAEIMVPESQIVSIKKGQKVVVVLKNSGKEIKGTIDEYSTSSLRTGGQYLAKINLNKKDIKNVKLLSGMYVNVLLPEQKNNSNQHKSLVGKNAIVQKGQLTGVFTVSENNIAILRWVRLGKTFGDQVEILSGLNSGEEYISNHDGRLMNGVKVETK